ncbi:MAG: class IV adenylate cyclase [Spirochaetes bacterium]|nr:class IV adenylate cyclase [Spirochaetota bacterium]
MAPLEIEVKAYCDDLAAVEEKLAAMGARSLGSIRERDLYLNHPSRDFAATDEALRLRRAGDSVIMTYKGPKIGLAAKTRREIEVAVGDYDAVLLILEILGFVRVGSVVKERDRFALEGIEISLDRVEDLGDFVELEAKGVNRQSGEESLFAMAERLGLDCFERRSYLELILRGGGDGVGA